MLESVKNLVANSATEEAILSLMDFTNSRYKDYENDVLLLSGKFHKFKRESMLGVIEDGQKGWNKINYSILQLISLIEYEEEIKRGDIYIVKYSYGANLRAYLPPKSDYSNQTIREAQLIKNLAQGMRVKVLEPLYEYSINDYWAKVNVV